MGLGLDMCIGLGLEFGPINNSMNSSVWGGPSGHGMGGPPSVWGGRVQWGGAYAEQGAVGPAVGPAAAIGPCSRPCRDPLFMGPHGPHMGVGPVNSQATWPSEHANDHANEHATERANEHAEQISATQVRLVLEYYGAMPRQGLMALLPQAADLGLG